MNVADDNGQHLSPRVGLHAAGHMHLGAFLRQMKLCCEARDHFRRHEFAVGIRRNRSGVQIERGAGERLLGLQLLAELQSMGRGL